MSCFGLLKLSKFKIYIICIFIYILNFDKYIYHCWSALQSGKAFSKDVGSLPSLYDESGHRVPICCGARGQPRRTLPLCSLLARPHPPHPPTAIQSGPLQHTHTHTHTQTHWSGSVLKPGREQLSKNWPIRYYCASTRPQLKDLTRTFTRSSHAKITLAGGGQIWSGLCFVFLSHFFVL